MAGPDVGHGSPVARVSVVAMKSKPDTGRKADAATLLGGTRFYAMGSNEKQERDPVRVGTSSRCYIFQRPALARTRLLGSNLSSMFFVCKERP
jgi:hypothetical protein